MPDAANVLDNLRREKGLSFTQIAYVNALEHAWPLELCNVVKSNQRSYTNIEELLQSKLKLLRRAGGPNGLIARHRKEGHLK